MIVSYANGFTSTRYPDVILLTKSWHIVVRKLEELEGSVAPYFVNSLVRMQGSYILVYARA